MSDLLLVNNNENSQRIEIEYDTDFLVNKFLYFCLFNNHFIFSFDFFELSVFLKKEGFLQKPNVDSFSFFIEKGYEPFDATLVSEIRKLPNLCKLIIEGKTFKYSLIDLSSHEENEASLIVEEIEKTFSKQYKNVILFSGGYDSTLLAMIARDFHFNVELVNGAYNDDLSQNDNVEKEYSNLLSKSLNLPYRQIIINPADITIEDIQNIIEKQPNTAHYSVIYYMIRKSLKGDIQFISGQQADSVLNFGSTSSLRINGYKIEGIGELLRRYLYMRGSSIFSILFNLFNCKLSYKQSSMLVGFKKLPIIKNRNLYNSFEKLYSQFLMYHIDKKIILSNNLIFYCTSFLQGSDASGIVNIMDSMEYPLPFSSLRIIKYYINKKNTLKDIFNSKRIIHELLEEDSSIYDILSKKPNIKNISYENRFAQLVSNELSHKYEKLAHKYSIDGTITFNKYHLLHCLEILFND